MSFWSGKTLESRLPDLIDDFDPNRIDCAAYTLRVGHEVYISPSTVADAATRTKKALKDGEGFVIPPGQFAFLLTEERVKVPESAVAFISMKARIKFKGLVNVSGFHVDPGYHGRLLFAVYNAGPAHVNLAQGDDCFLIWYASLEGDSGKYIRGGKPFDEIPSDLISPIAGQFHSLAGLSDRIQQVEARQQVLDTRRTIMLTLLGTLIVLVINLTAQSCRPTTSPSAATGQPASPVDQSPTGPSTLSPSPAPTTPAPSAQSPSPAGDNSRPAPRRSTEAPNQTPPQSRPQ